MKIDPILTRVAAGLAADRVAGQRVEESQGRPTEPVAQPGNADAAILSSQAQDVRFAQRMLAQVPEVRADKVADLARRIAEGSFEVDAQQVADRLLEGGV